jgi:hypothetical protein
MFVLAENSLLLFAEVKIQSFPWDARQPQGAFRRKLFGDRQDAWRDPGYSCSSIHQISVQC